MLRKLIKNKKAQNTAEYAILISLVVAGIIAMQTYAQRALQSRVRGASHYLAEQTSDIARTPRDTVQQYEPYYLESDYNVQREDYETELLDNTRSYLGTNTTSTRLEGGYQNSSYDEGDATPDSI